MSGVVVERDGRVALVRLNEPETMNALSSTIRDGLMGELLPMIEDDETTVVVLTGTGKAFCAGGDIRSMANRHVVGVRKRILGIGRLMNAMLTSDTVVITAVNGAAVGAGFGIALGGDIVLAAEDAYFMGGFAGVGAIPDLGLPYNLTRLVGPMRAKEILWSNRKVQADEALRLGLAAHVYAKDALVDEAMTLAKRIDAGPLTSTRLGKGLIGRAYRETPASYIEIEAANQALAFNTDDFDEGVDAFLNKRKPDFKGQ